MHHYALTFPRGEEQRARDFYAVILGFDEIPKPSTMMSGGVWFRANGVELHFIPTDDFAPSILGHPAVVIENLGVLVDRLKAHWVVVEPDGRLPGYRRFHTYDFFGNQIEFLQELKEG